MHASINELYTLVSNVEDDGEDPSVELPTIALVGIIVGSVILTAALILVIIVVAVFVKRRSDRIKPKTKSLDDKEETELMEKR